MFPRLRAFLGIGVKSAYVRAHMARSNMDTLRYQAIFFTIVSLGLLASTFAPAPPWDHHAPETLPVYRAAIAAFVVTNIAFHFIARRLAETSDEHPTWSYFALYSYALIMLAIGAAITVYDYPVNHNFFSYIVVLVFVFGLLYIPPAFTIVALAVCAAAIAVALDAIGFSSVMLSTRLCAYALLVGSVSATNFHTRLRAWQASEKVVDMSMHDVLTGTKNRRALEEQAASLVDCPLFVVIGDIDEFKFFNDTYGHSAGDEVLREFAHSMQRAFGEDNVYRFGGDEFVAIARTDSREQVVDAIESWRSDLKETKIDGETFSPTPSIGYAGAAPATGDDVQAMLRIADICLFDAKEEGRNCVRGTVLEGQSPTDYLADESNQMRRRMNHLDELTGLPTMSYFATHAKAMTDSPSFSDVPLDVVYFNVENLKIYNERFGFTAGDELLVFTAHTIEETFMHSLVARFGDDRFVTLTSREGLIAGIERVHEAVRAFNPESSTVIRAGIYPYEHNMEISSACDRAKLACDHIKGRYNTYYYLYDDSLLEGANRQQFILDRFDQALASGHIQVHYQPIMRTIGPRICEFEALARWNDPDDGSISVEDFVPVLEEYRIIHRMDLEILEQVCRNYRTLVDEGAQPVPTNLNLSRLDLELCDIADEVAAIMERYDVPPNMVNIEITESAFSENQKLLHAVIERFHERGMQVWMDDFGSGYSSLNVLREFDFDAVKIDLQFLRHGSDQSREKSELMLSHIISMAKDLGIQTLAEGVEERGQYEFLKSIGCEKLQGFVFEKPADFTRMRELLTGGPNPVESPSMREYYDAIGQVNLLRPTTLDDALSHDIELSSGLPAAVIEFCGNHVRYLLWNSSYEDYLVDIGMNTIENSEAQMNDLTRVQAQGFFRIAEQYKGSTEWVNLTFYEESDLCTAMARCISVDEGSDTYSFVYIAFNLSKYLNRTGSTLPPIV
ncbi:MAG: bifunctional diguanylate cyclase/phosphodiesterase [Eggerthellaceae bacterium]|nr:bifunctional diguanylate cyclase/phosphodiesterase [Eggerthellaceae bacterium]